MTLTPMYRIAWRSLRTGATGAGGGLFTLEEAEHLAAGLNFADRNFGLHHWPEFVGNQAAPAAEAPAEPMRGQAGLELPAANEQ